MEENNQQGIKSRAKANREQQGRTNNRKKPSSRETDRPRRSKEEQRPTRREDSRATQPPRRPTRRDMDKNLQINERKKRTLQNRRKRYLCIMIVLAILIGAIGFASYYFYMEKYGLSDEEMNLSKYYETVSESDMAIVLNDEIIGVEGIVINDVPYISYDTVRTLLNSRFYWDSNENLLLYTLSDSTVTVNLGNSSYTEGINTVNTSYVIVKSEGNDTYIAAEFVQQYTNMEYEFFDEPNRIVIRSEWGDYETATIKKDTQVRYQGGVKSEILTQVEAGDSVVVIETLEEWAKVSTTNGLIGYVQISYLENQGIETFEREFEEEVYSNISKDYTINMAFHQVTNSEVNSYVLETLADTSGLTTIAPTWFFINNTDGDVVSLASETYVNYAHQMGIEVWAVLNDFDGDMNSSADTYEVLSSTSTRTKIINQVIAEVLANGIDGINVDIENVSTEAGVHYIQFIRELSVKCRQNQIVLSVDNYPPKAYNSHFDYEEQGIVVDYVVIMSYDEHYGGSLEAGSVSSITYVEEAVEEMLTMVPAEKIINAIPFYTRLWASTPKTDEEIAEDVGTDAEAYDMNVTSSTYGMANALSVIEQAGATYTWDETTQQNYATWTVDDTIYEIWLEDAESIAAKLEVMSSNNLAGTAAWKLGFEDSSIWNIIQKYVN